MVDRVLGGVRSVRSRKALRVLILVVVDRVLGVGDHKPKAWLVSDVLILVVVDRVLGGDIVIALDQYWRS